MARRATAMLCLLGFIRHRLGWIRLGYGEMTEEFRVGAL